jgi:hypothetical protein
MSFQIMREVELTMVPTNILHNPDLSLAAKGAAAVMFSYADLHCPTNELAKLLGVSENRAIAICHELQDAGYGNMFRVSEPHD